jgi:hypothetical protein
VTTTEPTPAYREDFVIDDEVTGREVYEFRCNICGTPTPDAPCPEHAPRDIPGLRLVDCDAQPRHWIWVIDAEDYGHPCLTCICHEQTESIRELEIARDHHWRWRGWRITGWLNSKAYALGITAGASWGTCSQPGHRCCHRKASWRGKRPYVLGWRREKWACILRYRHWPGEDIGFMGRCGKCVPWTCCGSTGYDHADGCPEDTRYPTAVSA